MKLDDLQQIEIVSQAPTRISFAGGGTDVSPFPELHGGAVVSTTISIFMSVRLRLRKDPKVIICSNTRPEPITYENVAALEYDGKLDFIKAVAKALHNGNEGFEVYLYSPLPMCSGLGGSGAMCVALLDAFNHMRLNRLNNYELAEMAYDIETRQLGNASGRQDQYAAAFGGFNQFEFLGNNHVRVNRLDVHRACERILNQALALLWIGERKPSGSIIQNQSNGLKNGGQVVQAMQASKALVHEMCEALTEADIPRIGLLLDSAWQEKKKFDKDISTPLIDAYFDELHKAGMLGGKLSGAGGGGHMLVCSELDRRDEMLAAAMKMGLRPVPFTFVHEGVMSWQSILRTIHDAPQPAAGA